MCTVNVSDCNVYVKGFVTARFLFTVLVLYLSSEIRYQSFLERKPVSCIVTSFNRFGKQTSNSFKCKTLKLLFRTSNSYRKRKCNIFRTFTLFNVFVKNYYRTHSLKTFHNKREPYWFHLISHNKFLCEL